MTDKLTERLLAKPVGPAVPPRQANPEKDFTRQIEVNGDDAEITVRVPQQDNGDDQAEAESTAYRLLMDNGEDPAYWEKTSFRVSEWTMANGANGLSVRFMFKRRESSLIGTPLDVDLDYLIRRIKRHKPKPHRGQGDHGAVVALGDMQFGKVDGDGVEGTLQRTIDYLDSAADRIEAYRKRFDIGHVHVAFLGDHIEGFVSQGGANTARTVLTLTEQTRLTRRVMYHAAELFAPMAEKVSMVAVPGNHGEPQRFQGKGITRYDDSHDTEALVAVEEGLGYNPATYGHVEFFVPDTDELTVVTQVAGTVIAHAHGHQWRVGKHFDWWRGQAFHAGGLNAADVLLAGHLHHLFIETDGPRTFVQVPALESESTWFRHTRGSTGNPGLVLSIVRNGRANIMEVVQ